MEAYSAAPAGGDRALGFRPEFGEAGQETFLRLLSRDEREQLYELVEGDVVAAMEVRHAASVARQREEARRLLGNLADTIARENAATHGALARVAVDLALNICRRILRRALAADPAAIVRALEVLLLKLTGTAALHVTVNPADAAFLRDQPDLLARLRIVEVEEDRRLEQGGCLVRVEQKEWDATVGGQLAALEEAITASLESGTDATGGDPEETGGDHPRSLG